MNALTIFVVFILARKSIFGSISKKISSRQRPVGSILNS